jgi:ankyrin repeat protein
MPMTHLKLFLMPARAPEPAKPPSAEAPRSLPSFEAPRASAGTGESRQPQLLGMALENLHRTARRSAVSDMRAAVIDLNRLANDAGKTLRELLNAPDPSGKQLLAQVAETKLDVRAKIRLLNSIGYDLAATDATGYNGLHLAARENNTTLLDALATMAKPLLNKGTARLQSYTEATPLAAAIILNHHAIVSRLLLLGARVSDPCCTDSDRMTLNAQDLYARLDDRTPEMSTALRIGRTARQPA